ncbi:hypothetical protein D8S78_19595 [Natrialba swarupiae]|nr:hypothetical protein [Natrialba swarupiae]
MVRVAYFVRVSGWESPAQTSVLEFHRHQPLASLAVWCRQNVLTEFHASEHERGARQDRTQERVLNNVKHSR